MPGKLRIGRLVVIGVGLIGGSFALALKKARAVKHVVGVGRTRRNLATALKLGIIDEIAMDARILLYTMLATLVVALACGVAPAIHSTRRARHMPGTTRTTTSARHSVQWLLVGVQIALSTAATFPGTTASAFELAARLGYDGVELMPMSDPVSQDVDAVRRLNAYGLSTGDVASALIVESMRRLSRPNGEMSFIKSVYDALAGANRELHRLSAAMAPSATMGATTCLGRAAAMPTPSGCRKSCCSRPRWTQSFPTIGASWHASPIWRAWRRPVRRR